MSEQRFASTFLVPGALWLVAFFLIPIGILLAISFGYTDELGNSVYSTRFDNFEQAAGRVPAAPAKWSLWVRLVRRTFRLNSRQPARTSS